MGGFISDQSLDFTGVQQYTIEAWCWIDRPHHGRLATLARFDASAGFYRESIGMIETLDGDSLPPALKARRSSTRFYYDNSAGKDESILAQNIFAPAIKQGQWVHVVAVREGSKAVLYLNAQPVSSSNDNIATLSEQQVGLYVGTASSRIDVIDASNPVEMRPFAGLIDEVAVYDRALTPETIQLHHSLGQPVVSP